jgi:hypothetical protein
MNPSHIYKSAQFIDNSHFEQIYAKFQQNIQNDPNFDSNYSISEDKLHFLSNYFEWIPIPGKYAERK